MRIPSRPPRRSPRARAEEMQPMDPVAVTLAVWLGLIACVTGVVRLSENAADQAARRPDAARTLDQVRPDIRAYAFGG